MLFIVWGWRARMRDLGWGQFHCPNEGGDRHYRLVEARKWFTLFWIPMIPLDVLGEYVECKSCGATYDPAVRDLPTTAQIEDTLTTALRHIVVEMIKADGYVDRQERRAALDVMQRFVSRPYNEADLQRDLVELEPGGNAVSAAAGLLNEHGKESVLQAALLLAAADGEIVDEEVQAVLEIGRELGMSPAHIRGVLAEATSPSD